MKKIFYSDITKFIAVLLFIAVFVLGILTLCEGYINITKEDDIIFAFEENYKEMKHMKNVLYSPQAEIVSAYIEFNNQEGEKNSDIGYFIRKNLDTSYFCDKTDYYININGNVFTNTQADINELMSKEYYLYSTRDESGIVTIESSQDIRSVHSFYYMEEFETYCAEGDSIIICTAVKDSYAEECKVIWKNQADTIYDILIYVLAFLISDILILLYLFCVCGRKHDGEYVKVWMDNIWLEIHIIIAGTGITGAVALGMMLLEQHYYMGFSSNVLISAMAILSAIVSALFITALLSVVRNIKHGNFAESSIIFKIARWIFKSIFKLFVWSAKKVIALIKLILKTIGGLARTMAKAFTSKTNVVLITMLLLYTAAITFLGIGAIMTPFWIFVAILLFIFACFVVVFRSKDLDSIKKGAAMVRNGNLTYKIPQPHSEDLRSLAGNINGIANVLDESLTTKLKAERLKTDLITNVSHDLKTPLTSIISYTELLSNVESLPEEANDYIRIIADKSQRLKNLTQDLFDISKAQSGNENITMEKIDVSVLVNQTLGEYDSEIQKSGLTFCVSLDKDLFIMADGRKMSRAVSNLISNILKYSMKSTRVFISSHEIEGEAVIEFKNIASYPIEFDNKEIMGRFVRGDSSRTTEGNGLGLAIVKSYTELCGGSFDINTDGDMFKAIIKFNKYHII